MSEQTPIHDRFPEQSLQTADPVGVVPPKIFFYTLDGIRGIAAILIVLRHAESLFAPLRLQESYLAVDVFFVLSGVVISQAYGMRLRSGMGFAQFARIRAARIMPLYLLGTLISLFTVACGLISVGSWRYAVFYAVLAIFMIPNPGIGTMNVYPLNNPAWSLPLELSVNFFYARLIRVLSHKAIAAIMATSMLGIAFTLYRAQSHSLNIGFWVRTFPFGLFRVGYSFFAGVIIFDLYSSRCRQRTGSLPTVASWVLITSVGLLFACSPSHRLQPYYDFFAVILVFPFIVFLALLVQPAKSSARICRFLGVISYAVYTLHAPMIGLVEALVPASLLRYSPPSGMLFMLALIVGSFLVDRLFDSPIRRFLLRRSPPQAGL